MNAIYTGVLSASFIVKYATTITFPPISRICVISKIIKNDGRSLTL